MDFFDPNAGTGRTFAMGGAGHLALIAPVFGLLALLILSRDRLGALRASRAVMAGTAGFVLALEALSYALKLIYPFAPAFERIPLHLCASLKIALALLVLLERYDLLKFLSTWAIAAGFISFANLNLEGQGLDRFMFWHYLVGHWYLFLLPIFLFLTGDFRYDLRSQARSVFGLFVWSLVVFCVNWALDTNYMYFGPHNRTAVPFVPDRFMVWPLGYVAFALSGIVLLGVIYLILRHFQGRMGRGPAREAGAGARPLPSLTSG